MNKLIYGPFIWLLVKKFLSIAEKNENKNFYHYQYTIILNILIYLIFVVFPKHSIKLNFTTVISVIFIYTFFFVEILQNKYY